MDLQWYTSFVPKDQTIYSSVKKRKYHQIFGKHDDWVITDFIYKVTDEGGYEPIHKIVPDSL